MATAGSGPFCHPPRWGHLRVLGSRQRAGQPVLGLSCHHHGAPTWWSSQRLSFKSQHKHMYLSSLLREAFPAASWQKAPPCVGASGRGGGASGPAGGWMRRPLLSGQPVLSLLSLKSHQHHHLPFFPHLSVLSVTSHCSGFVFAAVLLRL